MTKLKWTTVAFLTLSAGAGGTAGLAFQQTTGPSASPTVESRTAEGPGNDQGRRPLTEVRQLSGTLDQGRSEPVNHEMALAELEMKRAEERLAWAKRVHERGYVSNAELIADQVAFDRARFALELARTNQGLQQERSTDRTSEVRRHDELALQKERVELKKIELQQEDVTLAQLELKRAEDRLAWAKRMYERGYVPKPQLLADEDSVDRAKFGLELAQTRQAMKQDPSEAKLWERQIQVKKLELRYAQNREKRAQAIEASRSLVRQKNPGPLAEAEWEQAKAESAAAADDGKLKQAELNLLEIRLHQAK